MTTKLLFLCTGGNKGIGREIVSQLFAAAPQGTTIRVLLASRDLHAGEAEMRILRGEGKDVHAVQLDLQSEESVGRIAEQVNMHVTNFGSSGLAVLINNAGMAFKGDRFGPEMAMETLQTNVFGTMAVTFALLPSLKRFAESADGKKFAPRIVFLASSAGRLKQVSPALQAKFSSPHATHEDIDELLHSFVSDIRAGKHREKGWPQSMYGISKLGLIAHSNILARELAGAGILCHACCPGWCKTDMSSQTGSKTAAQGAETPVWLATKMLDKSGVGAIQENTGGFWREKELIEW